MYRYSWFITRFKESSAQQEVEDQENDWFLDPVNSLLKPDSSELFITTLDNCHFYCPIQKMIIMIMISKSNTSS